MKQIHQKELEDKDEELEDARQSCQRRVGWAGGREVLPPLWAPRQQPKAQPGHSR